MAKKSALGGRSQEYTRKFVGLATLVTGEKKAKFTLTEEDKKLPNGETSITVLLSDLPNQPKIQPNEKQPKEYRIRLNRDGDAIEAIMPVRGHFTGKLVDLGKRPEKDADPVPFEKVFHEGQKDEERHLEFFAVYQITSGFFKGVQLPAYNMHYKFEENPENEGFTRYAFNTSNPKATRGHQLIQWMEVHGLDTEPIPWDDDTILPTLLERALENDVPVEINMSKGYILRDGGIMPSDGYAEANFGEETEDIDGDDESIEKVFPPVKEEKVPAKKVSKPEAKKPVTPAKKIKKQVETDEEDDL
jgi:hypothetical protein